MRSPFSRFFLPSLAILALLVASGAARAADVSYARIVRVSLVSGDVQISRPGHSSWEPAVQNMPVMQGITIGTNDGYAEVQFEDGSTAWISQNTLVQFTELTLVDGHRISRLTLGEGTLSLMTEMRHGDIFSVSTSAETVAVAKNSFFRMDCFHDGASVSVLAGELQITSAAGTRVVNKGQTLAYQSKLSNFSLKANPKPDNWDRWTVSRARATQLQAAQSSSYVTPPFRYGLADMAGYGNWTYFAGYGYGWQPYGISSCWMPFSDGGWGFYPGFGWTWVSAEPWGWVPYHFGNWEFLPYNGWTWFPSDMGFWDPAPVQWYSTGNQVGWWPATSGFIGSPALQYQQIAYGCSGYGYRDNYGTFGNRQPAHLLFRPNRGPLFRGKKPVAPRLMLTTSQLGRGREISLLALDDPSGLKSPIRSLEPAENGKPARIAASMPDPQSRESVRMVAPMTRDTARLQRSLARTEGAVLPARVSSILPSMPSRNAFRAANGMLAPAMPSHRPSPMVFRPSIYGGASRGYSPRESGVTTGSSRPASAPVRMAPSSAASHPSAAPGRPH